MKLATAFAAVIVLTFSSGITARNCTDGVYCPAQAVNDVTTIRLKCVIGMYCPANGTADFCPAGYYCTTPVTRTPCPEGNYCPPATVNPVGCPALSYCPEKSQRYFMWGPFFFLVGMWIIMYYIYRKSSPNSTASAIQLSSLPDATPRSSTRLHVAFEDLKSYVNLKGQRKAIINSITGEFAPGQITAIMGPSGSGKTSLMSVLLGESSDWSGKVTVNGHEANLMKYKSLIGYVPQDDIMIPYLTVREVLTHSANVRLPCTTTAAERQKVVDNTLHQLGLTGVADTIVGDANHRGISGGQKKRVNIGIELVTQPLLLFLDEPTTGLDAAVAYDVVKLIRSIADTGITVVAVLHQPRYEIATLLDNIHLLATGGRTVFTGSPANALSHFSSAGYPCPVTMNPLDWYIDVINGRAEEGKKLIPGAYSPSKAKEVIVAPINKRRASVQKEMAVQASGSLADVWARKLQQGGVNAATQSFEEAKTQNLKRDVMAGWWFQVWLFTYRGFLQFYRNLGTISTELGMQMLTGLVIGIAFVHDFFFIPPIPAAWVGFCPPPLQSRCQDEPTNDPFFNANTYTVMATGLICAVTGVRNFGFESENFFRESRAGISTSAYVLGKCISEIPLIVLYAFTYTLAYFLVAAPPAAFGPYFLSVIALYLVWFGTGYIASSFLRVEPATLLTALAGLLCGLGVDRGDISKQIVWSSFFCESAFISYMREDDQSADVKAIIRRYANIVPMYNLDAYGRDIGVLIAYAVGFRIIAAIILSYKAKKRN